MKIKEFDNMLEIDILRNSSQFFFFFFWGGGGGVS